MAIWLQFCTAEKPYDAVVLNGRISKIDRKVVERMLAANSWEKIILAWQYVKAIWSILSSS